jgi:sulfane dehydrogenase subunit SoxC
LIGSAKRRTFCDKDKRENEMSSKHSPGTGEDRFRREDPMDSKGNPADLTKASRRKFLTTGAAAAALGAVRTATSQASAAETRSLTDQVAYGDRSHYVTSVRVAVDGRPSPDEFGMTFHVLAPLQDFVGTITPSSLHFIGTHRGSIVPDIDPQQHRLMIHGLVDRPLEFSMDDLKRFPSVSRVHFIECLGNHSKPEDKTVQETHGLTSSSEWTGVLLSVLLKECGVQKNASWVVSEGAEEVKGAGSIRLAKAMDDCIVAYGQNGEPIRPQQGFPMRLVVPGFEGIYNTKWLRRIKVVDRYYMTYNDYGHISKDEEVAALTFQWGPKSVITFPSGGQNLPTDRVGVVGRRRGAARRSFRGRRPHVERGGDPWAGPSESTYAIWHGLEVGRGRMRAAVALHRRTWPGTTLARGIGRVFQGAAGPLQDAWRPGLRQHDPTVAGSG